MGSEPDLTIKTETGSGISSQHSFFSLDSGNTEYFTARESVTGEVDRQAAGSLKLDERLPQDTLEKNSIASSLNTVGGSSFPSEVEGEEDMTRSQGSDAGSSRSNGVEDEGFEDSDTEFELKPDVSKICNDISEVIPPDTKKTAEINYAVALNSKASLKELRKLAISEGGLLSSTLRKDAWPILLGVSKKDISSLEKSKLPASNGNVTPEIKRLVKMDVARVLKRFPPGLSDPQQDHLQMHLSRLIIAILDKNPDAFYYQGFHDISLTFLLACSSQGPLYSSYLCLDKMINSCLAPFMEKTMEFTHELIHVLFAILESEDIDLFNKIVKDSKCPAAFCIPWVLTWFSHTLPNDHDVFRVYDFVLGSIDIVDPPYLIPIFISASLVLRNAAKLKAIRETDIATMHHALATLPSQQESLEPWLQHSVRLMKSYKGKEGQLIGRAVHIKELQNQLWNSEGGGRDAAAANGFGFAGSIGRYIFVKRKWYTMAVVVLGAAYLLQAKYGSNFQPVLSAVISKYTPDYVKRFYEDNMAEFEFGRF